MSNSEDNQARPALTNAEAITEMMEFSKHGVLAQVFILDALGKQARAVANAPPASFDGSEWGGFINAETWQAVAREISDKLDKHLGK